MSSKKVFQIVYQCIVKRYGEEDHPSRVPEEPENPQTQENKCCQYRISKLAGISLFDGIDQRVPDGHEEKQKPARMPCIPHTAYNNICHQYNKNKGKVRMVGKPLLILSLSVHIDTVLINMDIVPLLLVIYMDAVPAYMNLAVLILYMHAPEAHMHILILITIGI